ncbi:hypothetical protein JB92DRAFT_58069 [Gautieria morchelliformis]|nr:hypothetical protein JB92DRAFT_58069 [Gautieria morchelliformis]
MTQSGWTHISWISLLFPPRIVSASRNLLFMDFQSLVRLRPRDYEHHPDLGLPLNVQRSHAVPISIPRECRSLCCGFRKYKIYNQDDSTLETPREKFSFSSSLQQLGLNTKPLVY